MGIPSTVIVKAAGDLSQAETASWTAMRAANPALYSPYFHPDYTALMGRLREDAKVAIALCGDKPVAFLPFQGNGFAHPIGAPMTDYHGFIAAPGADFSPVDILRDAGIGALHFSAMVDSDNKMTPFIQTQSDCTMMDLTIGGDPWRAERDSSYRRHLKSHRRRVRKAEEDIGKRRFEFMSGDQAVFDQLIAWKKQKFDETGKYDVLGAGWTLDLLRELWANGPKAALRADMHAMYFGDRLAAVDLGLSDGLTFHSWIVAYDNDLQTYAPGIQLLESLIDEAGNLGYKRIDLGGGLDGYKRHYASDPISVGGGFAAVKGPAAALSQLYSAAERLSENAPIGSLSKVPGKVRRRYSQIAACDTTFSGRTKAMISAVKTSSKG